MQPRLEGPASRRRGGKLTQQDDRDRQMTAMRERLTRLSEASLRINESLDLDEVLQGVLDSARSLTGSSYALITTLDPIGAGG